MVLFAFCLSATAVLAQQTPQLTKDINTSPLHGNPENLMAMDTSLLFFTATDGIHGNELWKTDGTTTEMVANLSQGANGTTFERFVVVGKTLFFNANGTLHKSDGTESGTVKVSDAKIFQTPGAGKGLLFFTGFDATNGYEPWVSDGTSTGTHLLQDIYPGSFGSNPSNFLEVDGTVFFTAKNDTLGTELWKSDGTAKGTVLVKDIMPGSNPSNISNLVAFKNKLFFAANDGVNDMELWTSDGTDTGTVLSSDIVPGFGGSAPNYLTVSGSYLYFTAGTVANGNELYRTDGSKNGAAMVKDLNTFGSSWPRDLVAVNGKVFFTAEVDNGRELYVSDGTTTGTKMTRDLYPIQTDGLVKNMTAVGNVLYFTAHSKPNYLDIELYRSDGTSFGTKLVKDIVPGGDASSPQNLIAFKDLLYFTVDDRINGNELWSSGGSAGTALFADIYSGTGSSDIKEVVALNGGVVFTPTSGKYGRELWRSKGDTASTQVVHDLVIGKGSSSPEILTIGKDKVYFYSRPGNSVYELYSSDGITASSSGIYVTQYYDYLSELTFMNGELYFARNQSNFKDELWSFTPGKSSARKVKKIAINGLGAGVDMLTPMNGHLYFSADDGNTSGRELWKSDGSSVGTVRVKDINSGSSDSRPSNLTAGDSVLYFTANDGKNGNELWVTDGTEANTKMVIDFTSGSGGTAMGNFITIGNTLFFTVDDGTHGTELWTSDGTEAGTQMVKDIFPGLKGSEPSKFFVHQKALYFSANDSLHGAELWITDGTETGTRLVKDIWSGTAGSSINEMISVRDELYFTANNGKDGLELWKTNGSDTGTVMLPEVVSGAISSYPRLLTLSGDTLYYVAYHPKYGDELWSLSTNCLYANFESETTCENQTALFKNLSNDLGNTIASYEWDFGNGNTDTAENPSYTYPNSGTYNVSLTIKDPEGCSSTRMRQHVVSPIPVADFTLDLDSQCQNDNSFAFTNVSKPDTGKVAYKWLFSDGGTGIKKDHTKKFSKSGEFTVKLVTTLNGICKDTAEQMVTVLPIPVTSAIMGKTVSSSKIDTYTVTPRVGSTYAWDIIRGTQISGGTTNEAVVEWDDDETSGTVRVVETNGNGCIGKRVTQKVNLEDDNGVGDSKSTTFSAYPNPVNDLLNISFNSTRSNPINMVLINSTGQVVMKHVLYPSIDGQHILDVSNLARGMYRITLVEKGNQSTVSISIVN